MDYSEITKRDMKYQKKLLEEYQSRLGALPPGRLKRKLRGNEAEYYHVCGREIYICLLYTSFFPGLV